MKKFAIVMILLIIAVVIFVGYGSFGQEGFPGNLSGFSPARESDAQRTSPVTEVSQPEATETKPQEAEQVEEAEETAEETAEEGNGGGNAHVSETQEEEGNYISILVSEDNYYYENEVVELDEIIAVLSVADEDVIVKITDNEATHRVYSELLEELDGLGITYVEVNE